MINMVTKASPRHRIAKEIQDIKERVKEVAERRDRYKVDTIYPAPTLVDPRIAALYTRPTDLVGINQAKEEIITMLTEGEDMSTEQRRIVSIVGFGGLGKTTLAKAVYDELKAKFDCTVFMTVSQNPDIKNFLKGMLYVLDKQAFGSIHAATLNENQLIDLIREFLKDKRSKYLIVIDDIWDMLSWNTVRLALDNSKPGSKIILTTRNSDVAEKVHSCYRMKPLLPESSKALFYGRIFGSQEECPKHLFEVSEKILKKCGGVFAIITVSSLLANKQEDKTEWNEGCG
ncbi:hypothetical protein ACP4OV_026830 [Aristida adscensionis]